MSRSFTTKEFLRKARKVHGYKYEYNKVRYINQSIKVKIRCKKHNYWFYIRPGNHLIRRGCKFCGRERTNKSKIKWTKKICENLLECGKYKRVIDLIKKDSKLYQIILKKYKDLINKYFPNRKLKYTKEDILKCFKSKDVKSRKDLITKYENIYNSARRSFKTLLDSYFPAVHYSLPIIRSIASKYIYRSEFKDENPSAYVWCIRNKCIDLVCQYMKVKSGLFKRILYKYVFPKKRIYIGITANPIKRDWNHRSKRGKHSGLLKRFTKVKMVVLKKNLKPEVAIREEENLIKHYRKLGWNVLNDSSTRRSLGYVKDRGKVFNVLNYKINHRPD